MSASEETVVKRATRWHSLKQERQEEAQRIGAKGKFKPGVAPRAAGEGAERAQPEWTTACRDWERRIVAGESLISLEAPLYAKSAKSALAIFNNLRVMDVAGSPRMGDISRPWLTQLVSHVFGSYDERTGHRRISEFFVLVSKKNAKSTSAAGIMLTALLRNWRRSAEFLIVAPTIEIANNSFGPVRDMIANDPDLGRILHVQDHFRMITHRLTKATLKIVAADNDTLSGKKASGVLIDELWLFGKRAKADSLLREATGGLASRPEGFVIYLSTQSDEAPAGVFRAKLMYARDVRDGVIEDRKFLPVLYEFPEAMLKDKDYLKPQNFYVTNPNLGASVDAEYLAREVKKAQATGDEALRGVMSKNLNIEIGVSLRSDRWAGAAFWEGCAVKRKSFDEFLRESEVVTIGIDGGGLDDLLGFAAIGRTAAGRLHAYAHAWVHPVAVNRYKQEAARWKDFEAAGDLTIVESIGQDVKEVAQLVHRAEKAGALDNIGVDRAGIGTIVDAILALTMPRIEQSRIIGIPQGWKMVGAIKETERRLAAGALTHDGSALMNYAVSNARVEPRGNAIVITKEISGNCKIDPLMALLNAMTLMLDNPRARRHRYQMLLI